MLVGVNSVDLCILVIVVLVSMLCAYLLDFVAVFLDLVVLLVLFVCAVVACSDEHCSIGLV